MARFSLSSKFSKYIDQVKANISSSRRLFMSHRTTHTHHILFLKKSQNEIITNLERLCVWYVCSEVVPFVLRMDKPIFSSLLTDRWFYDITILRFCSTCTRHVQTINLDKWSHHNACCHIHRGQVFTRFSTGNVYNSPSSAASRSIVSSSSSSSSST